MSKVKEIKYSNSELEEFRAVIQEAKDEALDELQMLKERLDDLNTFSASDESMTYSMHMGDQGTEAVEREKTYAQVTRTQDYLKKLEEAMERIHKETYGICRECNILIAKQRLIAVPITTLSASFKIHKECPDDGIDHIEPKK